MKRSPTSVVRLSRAWLALWFLAASAWAADDAPPPRVYKRPVLPAPFTLTDHKGRTFDNASLRGKWTILYFGYTSCSDACPTTLAAMKGMAKHMAAMPDLKPYQFVFVSLDPYRDTREHLREHIEFFHPDFLAATGDVPELLQFTYSIGAPFDYRERSTGKRIAKVTEKPAADDYIVGHPTDLLVFNPEGALAGLIFAPHDPQRSALDFKRISEAAN